MKLEDMDLKPGDVVRSCEVAPTLYATMGKDHVLRWTGWGEPGEPVKVSDVCNRQWELVEPKPPEPEFEEWPLEIRGSMVYYRSPPGTYWHPCEIEQETHFSHWGGEGWPEDMSDSWYGYQDEGGDIIHAYTPQEGWDKRVFAPAAIMRREG